jgi:hypothetical protein
MSIDNLPSNALEKFYLYKATAKNIVKPPSAYAQMPKRMKNSS